MKGTLFLVTARLGLKMGPTQSLRLILTPAQAKIRAHNLRAIEEQKDGTTEYALTGPTEFKCGEHVRMVGWTSNNKDIVVPLNDDGTPIEEGKVLSAPTPVGPQAAKDAKPAGRGGRGSRAVDPAKAVSSEPDEVTKRKAEAEAAAAAAPRDDAGLRLDGPTLEQYVAAGYKAESYPPEGFAARETPYVAPEGGQGGAAASTGGVLGKVAAKLTGGAK